MASPAGTINIVLHDSTYDKLTKRRRYRRESFDEVIEILLREAEDKVAVDNEILQKVKKFTKYDSASSAVQTALTIFIQLCEKQEVQK